MNVHMTDIETGEILIVTRIEGTYGGQIGFFCEGDAAAKMTIPADHAIELSVWLIKAARQYRRDLSAELKRVQGVE